jgi:hypothetical protein
MASNVAFILAFTLSVQLHGGLCMRSTHALGWSTNIGCHGLCQYNHGIQKKCIPKVTALRDIGRNGGSAEIRAADYRTLTDFCETMCKVVKAPSSFCGPQRLFQDVFNSDDLLDPRPVVFKPIHGKPAPNLDWVVEETTSTSNDEGGVYKPVKVKPPPSPEWFAEETTTMPMNKEGYYTPVKVKPPPSPEWVAEEPSTLPTIEQDTSLHSVLVNSHQANPFTDGPELIAASPIPSPAEIMQPHSEAADNVETDKDDSNMEAFNHDDAALQPLTQSPNHAPSPSPLPVPFPGMETSEAMQSDQNDDATTLGHGSPAPALQTNEEGEEEGSELQPTMSILDPISQPQLSNAAVEDASKVKVVQLPPKIVQVLSSEQVSQAEQAIQSVIAECHIPGGRDWCCIKSCKEAAEKYNIKIVQASCVAYCVQANKASGK